MFEGAAVCGVLKRWSVGQAEAPVASSQSEQPGRGWVAGLGTRKLSVRWQHCVGTSECMPAMYLGCLSSPLRSSFRDCQEEQSPFSKEEQEGGCFPWATPGGLAAGAHGGCDEGVCGQPWPGCPVGLLLWEGPVLCLERAGWVTVGKPHDDLQSPPYLHGRLWK